jgi:hypothetical protein
MKAKTKKLMKKMKVMTEGVDRSKYGHPLLKARLHGRIFSAILGEFFSF